MKTKNKCILDNDFEAALERFENTSKNRKNYWWDCLEQIFNNVKSLSRKYILDPVTKTVKKIIECSIIWKCKFTNQLGEKVYLFKFFNEKNEIVFTKIGTTAREVEKRLKEEIRAYRKKFDIAYAEIDNVIDCGNINAEGPESFCRAIFMKDYKGAYLKNDRFLKVNIPVERFNELVTSYLSEQL